MIKLSIVIPVYNCEKYLSQCLDSIYNTDYSDEFEVILIDDGSTDNTKMICNDYSSKYDNLVFIKNSKNKGVSYSRNKAIKTAKGKYILFVDGDDFLDKDWYKTIRENLKLNKDVMYINNLISKDVSLNDLILHIICINKPYFPGPMNKLFNRRFILNNNIKFNEKMVNAEDVIFNLECIEKGSSFKIINESIYNYRIYIGSSTKSFNPKIIETYNEFYNKMNYFVNKMDFSEELKTKIINNIIYSNTFILFHRLSFDKYFKNRELYRFVFYDPYRVVLSRVDNTNVYSFKLNVFFFLIRCRLFLVIWLLLRLVNFIKYFNGKERIVKNNF
ncbi:MAG: glycosyltransferase family 2 protein [Bacilli bacterium]|nr:glycosyltransferase family 2 protein [Bacilli bacterium]